MAEIGRRPANDGDLSRIPLNLQNSVESINYAPESGVEQTQLNASSFNERSVVFPNYINKEMIEIITHTHQAQPRKRSQHLPPPTMPNVTFDMSSKHALELIDSAESRYAIDAKHYVHQQK